MQKDSQYNSFAGFANQLDSLFRSFLGPWAEGFTGGGDFPPINLWEEEGAYILEAEMPGYSLESIRLEVHGDRLTLAASRTDTAPDGATFRRRERNTESFERHLQLPSDVVTDRVEATLREGIPRVVLPVAEEKQARTIKVNG